MSLIFSKLNNHSQRLENLLRQHCFEKPESHDYDWSNKIFESGTIRRAHLDVVDKTLDKKLFMMHLCIFPKTFDKAPIYGFDIIAGPNKVTGAFLDFSPCGSLDHPFLDWFQKETSIHSWKKDRQLPDWAKNIFSKNMVAAGNISDVDELDRLLNLSYDSLSYYLKNIYGFWNGRSYDDNIKDFNFTDKQNFYCKNQKMNPHTPKVMASLGYSPEVVSKFIEECLFPEL